MDAKFPYFGDSSGRLDALHKSIPSLTSAVLGGECENVSNAGQSKESKSTILAKTGLEIKTEVKLLLATKKNKFSHQFTSFSHTLIHFTSLTTLLILD